MYLTVTDENSKFGTLVFIRKPIAIKKGKKHCVQVGRTLLTLQIQDRLNIWQKWCCLYKFVKKDLSNAIVHFEEAKEHFPREFKNLGVNGMIKMPIEQHDSGHKNPKGEPIAMTLASNHEMLSNRNNLDRSATQIVPMVEQQNQQLD